MPRPKGLPKTGGVKKGYKVPATLDKLAAREFVRQRVTAALEPMLNAQIAHAQGIGHVFTRDKNGKYTKIENPTEIERLLTTEKEGEAFWIYAKDPSVQAFSDLLNRAIDKPKEQQIDVKIDAPAQLDDAVLERELVAALAVLRGR